VRLLDGFLGVEIPTFFVEVLGDVGIFELLLVLNREVSDANEPCFLIDGAFGDRGVFLPDPVAKLLELMMML
jgi:hypothetical protein